MYSVNVSYIIDQQNSTPVDFLLHSSGIVHRVTSQARAPLGNNFNYHGWVVCMMRTLMHCFFAFFNTIFFTYQKRNPYMPQIPCYLILLFVYLLIPESGLCNRTNFFLHQVPLMFTAFSQSWIKIPAKQVVWILSYWWFSPTLALEWIKQREEEKEEIENTAAASLFWSIINTWTDIILGQPGMRSAICRNFITPYGVSLLSPIYLIYKQDFMF